MGNRVSQSGSSLNGTFAYDADDELTSFTSSGTSYASATFGYDADGQRTSETRGLSPGFAGYATQYGYDFDGNLTGITAAGNGFVNFKYDALGRQLGWQTGAARLDYQLDGNAPLTETNQTSSRMNLYGNGLVSSGGETLLYDGQGAVRQTTGSSSPTVQWSGSYQAYGLTSSSSGSTASPCKWGAGSGYRSDGFGPTGGAPLMKVGARYYDPEFGCFLTRDTELGQKPYVYCGGDPINFTDPTGHEGDKLSVDGEMGIGSGFLIRGATILLSIFLLPVEAPAITVALIAIVGYTFVSIGVDLIVGGLTRMGRKDTSEGEHEMNPPLAPKVPGNASSNNTWTLWTFNSGTGVWHNSGSTNGPMPNVPTMSQPPNPHD